MQEAIEPATSVWPAIAFAIFWAYLFARHERLKRDGRDSQPASGTTRAETTARILPSSKRYAQSGDFDRQRFLVGAQRAYELILQYYAAADAKSLAPLLDPPVIAIFCSEFDRRRAEGTEIRYDVVAVDCCELVNVDCDRNGCIAQVRFEADIFISERRLCPGGEEETFTRRLLACDLWTFRRESGSPNGNWTLIATQPA